MKRTDRLEHVDLDLLIGQVLQQMIKVKYSEAYMKQFACKCVLLKEYCDDYNIDNYNAKVGESFLEKVVERSSTMRETSLKPYKYAIRRLDCMATNKEWFPIRSKRKEYERSCFSNVVVEYEKYLLTSCKNHRDLRSRTSAVAKFLRHIEDSGCADLKNAEAERIYQALRKAPLSSWQKGIKPFLKYAFLYKLTKNDFSLIVPSVSRKSNVPTVYSPLEVETILNSIDRSAAAGKRMYAVAIIAARLGLRACDISGLTFDNVNFRNNNISITQAKTQVPLTLPLCDDVKEALLDYINNERPDSDDPHIFMNLRGYGILQSGGVTRAISDAIKASGVNINGRKHGTHAFRSSLATALLAEGNDYHTIQRVLGQSNIEATKAYAKADVEELRQCALPVLVPKGRFEAFLCGEVCHG